MLWEGTLGSPTYTSPPNSSLPPRQPCSSSREGRMVPARARRGRCQGQGAGRDGESPVPTTAHHIPATLLLSPGTPPGCLPPSPLPGVAPADGPRLLPSCGCIFPGAPCPWGRGMRGTRPRVPCLLLPGHPPAKNRPGLAGPLPAPRGVGTPPSHLPAMDNEH